ncbi:hypothetical protein ACTVCO_07635 [Sanguibacter sp. A247]|uniref:hypothetical protein n=1 Tax=unclassified Sanguibacter TaxID=2645534 RepID=UPI003FD72DB1
MPGPPAAPAFTSAPPAPDVAPAAPAAPAASTDPTFASAPPAPGLPEHGAAPAGTLPPVGASGFREALLALRDVPLTVWRGDSVGALRLGATVRDRAGNGWVWWLSVQVATGLLLGIIAATSMAKAVKTTAGIFDALLGGLSRGASRGFGSASLDVPFGALLGMVLAVTFGVVVIGVIRALALGWTLRLRGVVVPFGTTADLGATAWSVATIPLAVFAVLNLLPGAGIAAVLSFVALVFWVPYTIVSEGLIYVGLNRLAPEARKSLLVPHAMLTLAAIALMVIAAILINVVIVGSLT